MNATATATARAAKVDAEDAVEEDVEACARCGGTHAGLGFRKLEDPIRVGRIALQYWAECPATGEPILMTHAGPKGDDA